MSAIGNYEVISQQFTLTSGVQTKTLQAPAGKVVLGGGFNFNSPSGNEQVRKSAPLADGSGWEVVFANGSGVTLTIWATVAEFGC